MTVLVLVENETDLPHHQRILEAIAGVRSLLFSDPVFAQRAFLDNKIDLMIVADAIPDGGLAWLKDIHVKAGKRETPVIMITAAGDKEARRAAYEYGVFNVIEKPIDPASYLSVARNALSLVAMRRSDTAASTANADKVRLLTEAVEAREVLVIYAILHTANLADPALSRRMAKVGSWAERIAQRVPGISHEEAKRIGIATRVYDIGMLTLPANVRERRLELTAEDAAKRLRVHVERADEVFGKDRSRMIDLAALIARQHHERIDGRGYPDGLKGKDISVAAQVVAVSEAFVDAITVGVGARPSAPLAEGQALTYIERQTGTSFAQEIVDALRLAVTQPIGVPAGAPA